MSTTVSPRGDRRRTALLEALEAHLQDGGHLDSINIADISRRAGVTRSAFYFYFENKAAAAAALMERMYDESFEAADLLLGDGEPRARIEATIRSLFATWDRHEHLFRALLEVRATSTAVSELWDADRGSFVPHVAALIGAEREAGLAPAGADPDVLATLLLELNDRVLERLARDPTSDREPLIDGVVTIWLRTIYGGDR